MPKRTTILELSQKIHGLDEFNDNRQILALIGQAKDLPLSAKVETLLLKVGGWRNQLLLASHPQTSESILNKLEHAYSPTVVRVEIYKRMQRQGRKPRFGTSYLLATDPEASFRVVAAETEGTDRETLIRLAKDPSLEVRKALLHRKSIPGEVFYLLGRDLDRNIRNFSGIEGGGSLKLPAEVGFSKFVVLGEEFAYGQSVNKDLAHEILCSDRDSAPVMKVDNEQQLDAGRVYGWKSRVGAFWTIFGTVGDHEVVGAIVLPQNFDGYVRFFKAGTELVCQGMVKLGAETRIWERRGRICQSTPPRAYLPKIHGHFSGADGTIRDKSRTGKLVGTALVSFGIYSLWATQGKEILGWCAEENANCRSKQKVTPWNLVSERREEMIDGLNQKIAKFTQRSLRL